MFEQCRIFRSFGSYVSVITIRVPEELLQGDCGKISILLSVVLYRKLIIGPIIRHLVLSLNVIEENNS
jgi:hypothetical protein